MIISGAPIFASAFFGLRGHVRAFESGDMSPHSTARE
jgi:hypothetical protein